ncbi:MAG: AAA family ATPase, partial [Chloroflexota bacterium]|nr:AAA family ATPase [Chloroflexota bacterium]
MSLSSAPPRLTRLELHGFKSFAGRTVFAFESGITAVIGPNGSGKSNISDAVRWVLGEQSHGALRSKRTEDVIFAGGSGRAPSGMAEVAVTLDNTNGWLPIAFSEVTVTRRAYRTGENQYLINGKRVRLRDVAHLTASLGQSHTVVGQGLVDAALSQRAEERRGLFEHAADLTGLRLKAAEAERNLAETETNSARLTDLLTELEPRLKTLERAARQAREWKGVQDRLQALQQHHYGRLLRAALGHLAAASEAAAAGTADLVRGREDVDRLIAAVQVARAAAEEARAALDQQDARLQAVLDHARRIGHERDMAGERYAALTRRREDMADTQTGLDEQVASVTAELDGLEGTLAVVEAGAATARATVARLQADGATSRDARRHLERRVANLARTLRDQERTADDLVRRRALLEQRRETDTAERARVEAANASRSERVSRLAEELAAFDRSADADQAELTALDARLAELARAADRATMAVQAARAAAGESERNLGQATTRLDVLQRLHESGTGLQAGVRAALQAARGGTLRGIRGTVTELIEPWNAYDTAIEVALGGHLQDIVVERWVDAEAAITHLRRTNAGRATFQPLDTVGGGSRGRPAPASRSLPREALALPGAHGVAADLVQVAPELAAVVAALLGRTLVVEDLPVARAAMPLLPTGWSVVTLRGEIARTGGSVTGGAAVRESGVLTRERELRELPAEVERLRRMRETAVAVLDTATEEPRRIMAERQEVEATRAGVVAARKERQGQRARLASWLKDLQAEQVAAERRLRTLDEALTARQADLLALEGDAVALESAAAATRAEHEAALAEQARDAEAVLAAYRFLAEEQRRLATLDERLRAERRRQSGL